MSLLGEPRESWLTRVFRHLGYFVFGVCAGLFPALVVIAAASSHPIPWRLPVCVVLGSGAIFWFVGVLTRGRFLIWLLRAFGREIDSDW